MNFVAEYGWAWIFSLGGFLVLWPISLWRRDCSIVDFWWGPGFGAMALAVWVSLGMPTDAGTLIFLVPLAFWSVRLGIQLGRRRMIEGEEDPRYREMREHWSPNWGIKSLFVIFVLQAVLQGIIAAGVLAGMVAMQGAEVGSIMFILAGIAVIASLVEWVSDTELDRFRRRVPHGGLLTTGLRRHVRYPSYAAEIALWSALGLMAVLAGIWWAFLSPLMITTLLVAVSGVSILEDRLARTRPEFDAYRRSVPALLPRWPFGARKRGLSRRGPAE